MSVAPFTSASGGFTNITNFPDIPPDSPAMRAQFQTPINELISYINSTLLNGNGTIIADSFVPSSPLSIYNCRVHAVGAQSIPNFVSTSTILSFDTVDYDYPSGQTGSGTQINCIVAGIYHIYTSVEFSTAASGSYSLRLLRNGSPIAAESKSNINLTGARLSISTDYKLNVGDYIYADVAQNSGASLNTYTADGMPTLGFSKVG